MDKRGLNIAVVGGMGQGKSYWVKEWLKKMGGRAYIYDPNEEYLEFINLYQGAARIPDFAEEVYQKSRGAINVFEEATAFLGSGAQNRKVTDLMTRKRHFRVVNIFVFHSINTIPVNIFMYLNYLVVFKTNDRPTIIESKYKHNPELLQAFTRAKAAPKFRPVIVKFNA